MKKLLTTAAVLAISASAAVAATVQVDFVAAAAGNERGVEGDILSFTNGTDTLFLRTTSNADAYLDDVSGALKKPAGLGVCSTGLDANLQCNTRADDSVDTGGYAGGVDEWFNIEFFGPVTVSDFIFYDGDHNLVDASTVKTVLAQVNTLGAPIGSVNLSGLIDGTSTATDISSFSMGFGGDDPIFEFYLGGFTVEFDPDKQTPPVPLPAGLPLLVGGLAALGLAGRRRKKA